MKVFHRGEIINITIIEYAFGGKGVAKIPTETGDYIVFVANAFPGQEVQAKVDKVKKRYCEAKLIQVTKRSPLEKTSNFQEISGAPYIFVPVEEQETRKYKSTIEVYQKIGHFNDVESVFDEFISSPIHYFYRNKMEYSFSCIEHNMENGEDIDNAFALGFKRRGTWWKVENLAKPSGMFDEEVETKLIEIRDFLKKSNLAAWHPPQKKGFFRHLIVRKSFDQDQLLFNLVTSSENIKSFDVQDFGEFLKTLFGNRIAGFQHTINDDVADRSKIENGNCELIFGKPFVIEKLLGLSFEISMESFFQTNPKSAELLYTKAIDYVFEENINSDEVVMDLFCGTGTIGQLLANKRNDIQIIGVDIVPEAISDATRNATRNNLQNKVRFYADDVGKFLRNHPEFKQKINSIVLDPPRAGIAPKTLQKVIDLGAQHLVYISCNPSTQARDANTLKLAGYELEKLSFVDQFPHTGHIEAVAKFKKRSS